MIPPTIRSSLEENYGFMISRSSLLVAPYKELDLTEAVVFADKIPLTTKNDHPYTTVYNTHKINYHPPNANQHYTHKVVV